MADERQVARPYARAILEQVTLPAERDAWEQWLGQLAAIISDEGDRELLTDPHLDHEAIVTILREAAGTQTGEMGANLLHLLVLRRRLTILPDLAALFHELRAAEEGWAEVEVVVAHALDQVRQKRLGQVLGQRLGKRVILHLRTDPEVLGGALIRCGDLVIDGTVKGRLAAMAQAMAT
jgi:F-type H+-transporting ATPase subunit delta